MKVYKLDKEKQPGVVVVWCGTCNITDSIHYELLELKKDFDLFFVFNPRLSPNINTKKFSTLYQATWYAITDENQSLGMLDVLDYLQELSIYAAFNVTSIEYFPISKLDIEALKSLQVSPIETSVFKKFNLGCKEFKQIYMDLGDNNKGMYSSYSTNENILFIRPISIRKILKNSKEVLLSFEDINIYTTISSLIPPETHFNNTIQQVAYDLQTKRA